MKLPDLEEVQRLKYAASIGPSSTWSLAGDENAREISKTLSTFGGAKRFMKTLYSPHSPEGMVYYSHNELYDTKRRISRSAGMGYGRRTEFEKIYTNTPGPLAYRVVTSSFKKTSSIDGLREVSGSHSRSKLTS
jgi:hypothetical protein